MASCTGDTEGGLWDPFPCKLCTVVESMPLPIVVKVLEGLYGRTEGSTFSNGDLIKIDSYITIDKVRARHDQSRAMECQGEDQHFTVPLDYRGKVGMVPDLRDNQVVKVVNDLRKHVTKWVRVLQDATFYHQGNEQRLYEGDIIKVVEFKGHVMSCTRGQATLLVPSSVNGQFQVLPDSREYSVRDVVTKFILPRVVHFLPAQQQAVSGSIVAGLSNMDVFTGVVVLEERVREKMAVGHFKGLGEDGSRFARRSAIVLNLNDPTVAELEVQCPHYSEENDYQFFQMTHFSQSSGQPDLDPNALYMEFAKSGVRFIDYSDITSKSSVAASSKDWNSPKSASTVAHGRPFSTSDASTPTRRGWKTGHHQPSAPSHQGQATAGSSLTLPASSKPFSSRRASTGVHFTLADYGKVPSSEKKKSGLSPWSELKEWWKKTKQKFSRGRTSSSRSLPPETPISPSRSSIESPDAGDSDDSEYDVMVAPTRGRRQRPQWDDAPS